MKSLNEIIAELEAFATAHWQIHTFGHGDVWEISPQSDGIVYPILWMVPQTATPAINEVVDEFTVLCMDLVDSGELNETDVLSDTRQIMLDVCAYYQQTHTNDYIIEFGGSIQPFTERDPERVSGHSLTVRIKQPHDYNLCAVPASAVPVPATPSCADATVQNAASSPTYQASVASGDVLVLPQLKVLDSDGVTPILADYIPGTAGYAATCTTPSCADATITVNASPFGTVPSGGALDVPVKNSAGTGIGSKVGANWLLSDSVLFVNGTDISVFTPAETDTNIGLNLDGMPVDAGALWNVGTQTFDVVSAPCPPPSTLWTRPTEWIAIPDLTALDERFYGVLAVFENEYNSIAFKVTAGAANIDFGDGSNVNSNGAVQTHVYDYTTLAGAVNVFDDGRNYKQALVDITRIGGAIVAVDFRVFSTIARESSTNFLDINCSLPSCTALALSVVPNAAAGRRMTIIQRLRVWSLASNYAGVTNFVQNLHSLRVIELPWGRFGAISYMTSGNLSRVDPVSDIVTTATSLQSALFGGFQVFGNITANSATTLQAAFASGPVKFIGNITATSATNGTQCFANNYLLTHVGTLDVPAMTNMTSMFIASAVPSVVFTDCSAVTVTTTMFSLATNLTYLVMPGLTRGVALTNTPIGNYGMSAFANSLGVAAGAQTVTVTGTPFGALLTALDATAVAIAAVITGKGFTIAN